MIVVGGNFSNAGSLSCETICVLDPSTHQWQNLGDNGLSGEVLDFTFTGVSCFAFVNPWHGSADAGMRRTS